jgi:hypothetical protein
MDIAKVDQDVSYVAMVVHVCCNGCTRMLQSVYSKCFIYFQTYVMSVFIASILSRCCTCFSMASQVFLGVFQVFLTHV